mmetsp:Transcript_31704/g.102401  ORF Transcript_31704/g.102401 Transcript_31704/m.102401 type:complete len:433 (+) Transcript_31704:1406-2704(+)
MRVAQARLARGCHARLARAARALASRRDAGRRPGVTGRRTAADLPVARLTRLGRSLVVRLGLVVRQLFRRGERLATLGRTTFGRTGRAAAAARPAVTSDAAERVQVGGGVGADLTQRRRHQRRWRVPAPGACVWFCGQGGCAPTPPDASQGCFVLGGVVLVFCGDGHGLLSLRRQRLEPSEQTGGRWQPGGGGRGLGHRGRMHAGQVPEDGRRRFVRERLTQLIQVLRHALTYLVLALAFLGQRVRLRQQQAHAGLELLLALDAVSQLHPVKLRRALHPMKVHLGSLELGTVFRLLCELCLHPLHLPREQGVRRLEPAQRWHIADHCAAGAGAAPLGEQQRAFQVRLRRSRARGGSGATRAGGRRPGRRRDHVEAAAVHNGWAAGRQAGGRKGGGARPGRVAREDRGLGRGEDAPGLEPRLRRRRGAEQERG